MKKIMFLCVLALVLAACITEPDETESSSTQTETTVVEIKHPNGWEKEDETRCLENGGTLTAGLAGPACAMPTPDAGKSCNSSKDCTGFCLADGQVCSAQSPKFGCFELYENGEKPTICVD